MRWVTTYKHPDNLNFIIDEDLPDANLQDDLETAKFDTFHKFGVPEDSWVEIEEHQKPQRPL